MNWLGLAAGVVIGLGAERVTTRGLRRGESIPDLAEPRALTKHHLDSPDGGLMHVVEAGSGPALVLLHGVTLRSDIWHHQFALADEARVLAVDFRGHGESISGSDGPSIPANAADLAFLLERLDLTNVVIAGHSMGGMVLGQLIADHGSTVEQRVAGVGFISSAGRSPVGRAAVVLRPLARRLEAAAARHPKIARRLIDVPPNDLGQILVRASFGKNAQLDDVRETVEAFEAIEVDEFLAIAPSLVDHDVLDALASCHLPAAVLVGSHDRLTPPHESRVLATTLPNATLDILPDAGHQLMLERPDEVSAMLRTLLARTAVAPR